MKLNNAIKDYTPLNLTEEEKEGILKIIKDISSVLVFFTQRISANSACNDDVHTCLGMMEYRFADLSKATGYNGILEKQVTERDAERHELMQQVRALEEQRGAEVDATAVTAALRRYEDVFHSWYESCGFRYANIEHRPYGLQADFRNALMHTRERELSKSDEMFARFATMTPFLPKSEDWDIIKDDYNEELADTDKNRQNIIRLFEKMFPGAVFYEFKAHKNDCGSFSLGFDVYVPYEDIEKLEKRALEE